MGVLKRLLIGDPLATYEPIARALDQDQGCELLKARQQAVKDHIVALQENLAVIETKIQHYEQLEAQQRGERHGTDQVRTGTGQIDGG